MNPKSCITPKKIMLNNGIQMPRIGFGTASTNFDKDPVNLYKNAIKIGYRHFDTASIYGTEKDLGTAIEEVIINGIVKREDLFITTKLWNTDHDNPEGALKQSLEKLKLDYVDLFLVHSSATFYGEISKPFPLHKTWKLMEECVEKGLCKSIGISNFNTQLLLDLLSYAIIKPVCNQIELHPYLTQAGLDNFCQKNNIVIVAYSPLARSGNAPWLKNAKNLLLEPIIVDLTKKYNRTPAQIILNWHLSRNHVIIPKTSSIERMKENLEYDTFEISQEDIEKITELNCGFRIYDTKNLESFNYVPLFDQSYKIDNINKEVNLKLDIQAYPPQLGQSYNRNYLL